MKQEPDAEVKQLISKYLITGNLEDFVTSLNAYYDHIKGLKRYI